MSTATLDKRAERAKIWAEIQEYNARHKAGEDMSAEDFTAWQRGLDDIDRLNAIVETEERTEILDRRFAEIDEEQRERAARAGQLGKPAGDPAATAADAEYRAAFEAFMRDGAAEIEPEQKALLRAKAQQIRAQGVSSGSIGGYTVPEGFWAKVTETMKFFASVGQYAEVLNTTAGETIPWPTNDDTSNEGAILTENTQITGQDLEFGSADLGAYMYTSKLILVSWQLLQDSGVDIEGFIARKAGERIGRITNRHFTVGTGTNQPQGYMAGATLGKTAASATAITWEEMVDLEHSVDIAYRANGRYALHDLTLAYIRKMKDSDGRPLWSPGLAFGAPDTVNGVPYFVNNYMDTIAASKKVMAYGDFRSAFVVRNVAGASLARLTERYADWLQVGFFAFSRHDSVVQDASAVKYLATAAS